MSSSRAGEDDVADATPELSVPEDPNMPTVGVEIVERDHASGNSDRGANSYKHKRVRVYQGKAHIADIELSGDTRPLFEHLMHNINGNRITSQQPASIKESKMRYRATRLVSSLGARTGHPV
jgi:hypothetical protein